MFEWELSLEQERETVGAGRYTWGEVVATSAMASPCTAMYAALFAFQDLVVAGLFTR